MHSGEPTRLQCHKALEGVKKNGRRIASQLPAPVCMSVMKVSTKMIWRNKWKSLCNERLLHQRGKKKHPTGLYQILSDVMAGAEGLEPSTKVLETHVLPLHHTPKHLLSIACAYAFVNVFFQTFAKIRFRATSAARSSGIAARSRPSRREQAHGVIRHSDSACRKIEA